MSTQCVGEGVQCGITMGTLPDRVPVLPVETYPNPIPEENATRLGTTYNYQKGQQVATGQLADWAGAIQ